MPQRPTLSSLGAPKNPGWPENADYLSSYYGFMDDALRGYDNPHMPITEDPLIGGGVGDKGHVAGFYSGAHTPEGAFIHISQPYGRSIPLRDAQQTVEHETAHAIDYQRPGWTPAFVKGPEYSLLKGQKFDDPVQGPLHGNTHRQIMEDVESTPFSSRVTTDYHDTPKVRHTYGEQIGLSGYKPHVFVNVSPGDPHANIPLTLPDFEDYKKRTGVFGPQKAPKLLPKSSGGAQASLL